VGGAKNGTEGLAVVWGESNIGMVLTKLGTVLMDGVELVPRLKELNTAMPVVLITGSMVRDGLDLEQGF
jgi:DNA-binding NtrC family response regulator